MDDLVKRIIEGASVLDAALFLAIYVVWRALCIEREQRIEDFKENLAATTAMTDAIKELTAKLSGAPKR